MGKGSERTVHWKVRESVAYRVTLHSRFVGSESYYFSDHPYSEEERPAILKEILFRRPSNSEEADRATGAGKEAGYRVAVDRRLSVHASRQY